MAISVFDLFSVGIGPSSSHTVGPMRAARMFAQRLKTEDLLTRTVALRAELFGSLGATGHGHGTPKAVLLGLAGHSPRTVDVEAADTEVAAVHAAKRLALLGAHEVAFDPATDLLPDQSVWIGVTAEGLVARTHEDKQPKHSGHDAPRWLVKASTTDTIYTDWSGSRSVAVSILAVLAPFFKFTICVRRRSP